MKNTLRQADSDVSRLRADKLSLSQQLDELKLRNAEYEKKETADSKMRTAGTVVHYEYGIDSWKDEAIRCVQEAVDVTTDLQDIRKHVLNYWNLKYFDYVFSCDVRHRTAFYSFQHPAPKTNMIIFSIQGVTVYLGYKNK
ncbi:hypothetical protein HDE_01515 [Halotydeus destructor]|nr:hypothetical protein HDE_01515 [Halotydeus destructor]